MSVQEGGKNMTFFPSTNSVSIREIKGKTYPNILELETSKNVSTRHSKQYLQQKVLKKTPQCC